MKKQFGSKITLPKNYLQDELAGLRGGEKQEDPEQIQLEPEKPEKQPELPAVPQAQSSPIEDRKEIEKKSIPAKPETIKQSRVGEELQEENTEGKNKAVDYFKEFESKNGSIVTKIDADLHTELKLIATLGKGSMLKLINNIVSDWMETHQPEIKKAKRNGHF